MIIIRTDSSNLIGTGHLTRCLNLAKVLRKNGKNVEFVCRTLDGNSIDKIRENKFTINELKTVNTNIKNLKLQHSHWLGTSQEDDAKECINILKGKNIEWLIVDHYSLDQVWQKLLSPYYKKLMVIDDLADREHKCDLLLDQNLGSSDKRYSKLVPSNTIQLHGPNFALVNPIYSSSKFKLRKRSGKINRVLIYFGSGEQSTELMEKTINVFCDLNLKDIELDLVVNSNDKNFDRIYKIADNRGRSTIHSDLPHLALLMFNSDISVGACGSTTWERCCLGLPTILVNCAKNQDLIAKSMKRSEAAFVFEPNENLESEIKDAIFFLRKNTNFYFKMSRESLKLCDGQGINRVTNILLK